MEILKASLPRHRQKNEKAEKEGEKIPQTKTNIWSCSIKKKKKKQIQKLNFIEKVWI